MTQDPYGQYGQPPGSGDVVRGEVVPDDEADATAPNAPTRPMTQFQKVASALGGDRTDPSMPIPADPAAPSDPSDLPDQDARDAQDEADRDATHPEPVVAVRSPDEGSGDYWNEADETGPKEPAAASPDTPAADAGTDAATEDPTATQPDIYGTTARTPTDGATAAAAAGAAGAGAADAAGVAETDAADAAEVGAAESSGSLLPDVAEFRAQWQQVQFRFVDDPRDSVTEAAGVVAQVAAKLEAAIRDRQRALRDRWDEDQSADTESLRETLLLYRAFLDQLTGSK